MCSGTAMDVLLLTRPCPALLIPFSNPRFRYTDSGYGGYGGSSKGYDALPTRGSYGTATSGGYDTRAATAYDDRSYGYSQPAGSYPAAGGGSAGGSTTLKLRGLPYSAEERDIIDFFHGYDVR
jgi:hypothetical protein